MNQTELALDNLSISRAPVVAYKQVLAKLSVSAQIKMSRNYFKCDYFDNGKIYGFIYLSAPFRYIQIIKIDSKLLHNENKTKQTNNRIVDCLWKAHSHQVMTATWS